MSIALRGSSHRIETRFDLAREADPTDVLGTTLLNTRQTIGVLDAGAEFDWHFSLPEERLDLPSGPDDFGAYPLAVDVRSTLTSSTGDTSSTATSSTATTRLPTTVLWVPAGAQFVPTSISWLLPLDRRHPPWGWHHVHSMTRSPRDLATVRAVEPPARRSADTVRRCR